MKLFRLQQSLAENWINWDIPPDLKNAPAGSLEVVMVTQLARKVLPLLIIVSLLTTCAGVPSNPSTDGQPGSTTRFTYDPNGNLKTRTDANGQTTGYDYDALNRLIAIHYLDDTSVIYTYDSLGQRTGMTDSLGTTFYEYDIHGRLVRITDPNRNTLQYAYDSSGLLTQMVYPDGSAATFTWDGQGQLATAQDVSGITSYEYDLGGKLTGRTLPNGVGTRYEYDEANRLIAIRHTDSEGTLLVGFEYELDANGNRTQVMRTSIDGTQVTGYEYDSLSRLVRVMYAGGEEVTYAYDATGNRLLMNSTKEGDTRYTYNGLGQLAELNRPQGQVTFRYDANGNLLERVDKQTGRILKYTWDYENRLVGMDDGTVKVAYKYDGDGNRIGKIVNGKSTEYVNNINGFITQTLSEINSAGETRNYSYGIERIGLIDSGGVASFYLADGLEGSVSELIDNSGRISESYAYDAFGNRTIQIEGSGNPYTYDGEYTDGETGLIFLRARYYDPAIGRFLSNDIRMGSQGDPQSLNPFVFVRNNPINFVDPLGLDGWERGFGIITIGRILDWFGDYYRLNWFGETISGGRYIQQGQIGPNYVLPVNWVDWRAMEHDQDYIAITRYLLPGNSLLERFGRWGYLRFADLKVITGILGEGIVRFFIGDQIMDLVDQREYGPYRRDNRNSNNNESNQNTFNLVLPFFTGDDTWDDNLNRFFSLPMCPPFCGDGGGGSEAIGGVSLNNRFFPLPMCPPFCGDGGGGGAAVGGVSLNRAAEVLVNLNDITGASYDPNTGQVILIGRRDLTLPPMNMDDLVVAIRSIYGSSENPGVTMVPVDPSMQDITQRVEYFGQTQDTHFGLVMFEADRYLKSLAAGTDTLTGQPVKPNVPGFKSELDLAFETHSGDVPWHRNWFVPGEIVIKQSNDGRSMIFDKATILLQSRFIEFLLDGSQQDVPGSSPVTDRFTQFMTDNYDEFAAGKPELAELKQLAKIVGFVRWLHDNNIPVDLSWVNDYKVAFVDTPDSTPGIVAKGSNGSYIITSMGGVDYSTDNTYTGDVGENADGLAELTAASRPADFPISWDLNYNDETLTAVAFNVAPTEIIGGYATTVTDLAIPVIGGQSASFTRQYSSLDLGTGMLGSGWSQVVPELNFQTDPSYDNSDSFSTQVFISSGTDRRSFFFGENGLFHPDETRASSEVIGVTSGDLFNPESLPDGYYPQPGLSGQPLEILNAQGRPWEYSGFALLKQDGSALAFDQSGRIIGQRNPEGQQLNYTYDGELLTTIADTSSHSLQFRYDSNSQLTDLTSSDGQTIQYTYDASGNLSSVKDETGTQLAGYAYDESSRLIGITDQYGRVSQIAYDGLGRMISSQSSSGSTSAQYDIVSNQVTYTDATGNTIVRRYDDQNRLQSETDPWGNAVQFQYDEQDHISSFMDRKGNMTSFTYDELGYLTEAVSPLGGRTILWNYNTLGLPEASIDPANRITFYEYDERGRVTGMTSGLQLSEFSSDGNILYQEVDPQSISYTYDVAGNLASIQDAAGLDTHFSYDDLGNLTAVQFPGGGDVRQTFDERSQLTTIADPTGYQVAFGYTEQGQLANVTTPAGQTQYQYTNGLVTAITDPLDNTLQYGYTESGQLMAVTEPAGSVTTYDYDASGNLVTVKNALGGQTQFKYDAVGRVIEISYQPGTEEGSSDTPEEVFTNSHRLFLFLGIGGGLLVMGILLVLVAQRARIRKRKLESPEDWQKTTYPDDKDPLGP